MSEPEPYKAPDMGLLASILRDQPQIIRFPNLRPVEQPRPVIQTRVELGVTFAKPGNKLKALKLKQTGPPPVRYPPSVPLVPDGEEADEWIVRNCKVVRDPKRNYAFARKADGQRLTRFAVEYMLASRRIFQVVRGKIPPLWLLPRRRKLRHPAPIPSEQPANTGPSSAGKR